MRSAPFVSSLFISSILMWMAFEAAHWYALSVTGQGFVPGSPFNSIPYALSWVKTYPDYFIRWCLLLAAGIGVSCFVFAMIFHRLRANKPVEDMHGMWAGSMVDIFAMTALSIFK